MDKDFLYKFATSKVNNSFLNLVATVIQLKVMTQQEFTQRTLVEVSNDEFWAINEVYNNSDLNKDEFCKMWCKMNASRVNAAKRKIKEQQRTDKCRNILNKWFESWRGTKAFNDNYFTLIAYTKLPNGFVEALAHFGLVIGEGATLSGVYYKVGEELGYFEPFVEG